MHTDVIWDNFASICGADWGGTTIKLNSILSLEGESDSLDRVELGGERRKGGGDDGVIAGEGRRKASNLKALK